MKLFKTLALSAMVVFLALSVNGAEVVTQGKAIRNVVSATVKGKEMVYISEIDGGVSLNSLDGKQLWRKDSDNPALMAEILAVDINGDKSDELLGVSAAGLVYCWNSKGELLWKYSTPSTDRLSEIATIGSGKDVKIFAAGNRGKLYEIDGSGKELSVSGIRVL